MDTGPWILATPDWVVGFVLRDGMPAIVRHEGAERRPVWSPDLPCCMRDGGWPPGAGRQGQAPNHRELLR